MNKKLLTLTLAVSAAIALSACSDKGDAPKAEKEATTSSAPAAEPTAAKQAEPAAQAAPAAEPAAAEQSTVTGAAPTEPAAQAAPAAEPAAAEQSGTVTGAAPTEPAAPAEATQAAPAAEPAATTEQAAPAAEPAATTEQAAPAAEPAATTEQAAPAAEPAATAEQAAPAAEPAATAEQAAPAAEPAATTEQAAQAAPTVSASGLSISDVKVGDGAQAAAGQVVTVHYTGWLYDEAAADKRGAKFDSSVDRGQPFDFPLGAGRVIPGWEEGVAGMKIGGKRTLVIPAELGYGAAGAGGAIPPNATLMFDVELLGVQ